MSAVGIMSMQLKNNMKKVVFFFISFLVILLAFFIFYKTVAFRGTTKPLMPTPTPVAQPILYNSVPNNYSWSVDSKERARQKFMATKLINKLPYVGVLFSLSFDVDNDVFNLVLSKSNIGGANGEFDLFLKNNKVDSRSWIENLTVAYK